MKKHAIIKCLHEQQITNYETLNLFLCNTPIERIVSLVKDIQDIIEDCDSKPVYTPFMFLPNSDLSGIGGCNEITCKIKRVNDKETILLIDSWENQEAIDAHHQTPMMNKITELRNKYDMHMRVERYVSNEDIPNKDKAFIRQ